ncbi:hypothetical protein F5Y18DRAFT_248950 [Xylariaceae sp. FL1019]|nr:hypothetical protein F5Y18DRAFT_248950 [Xylariaceae sp. FL1019]
MPKAVLNATGHESLELFKIGCMLLKVQDDADCSLEDLEYFVSKEWRMPTGDYAVDLLDRVQVGIHVPCQFLERLKRSKFEQFHDHADDPRQVQGFLGRMEQAKKLPRTGPILSVLDFKTILVAEIWCSWAYGNNNPLPPKSHFLQLFGQEIAVPLAMFSKRFLEGMNSLRRYCCVCVLTNSIVWQASKDFQKYVRQWYGLDMSIAVRTEALNALAAFE